MLEAEAKALKVNEHVELQGEVGTVIGISPIGIHIRWLDGMKTQHNFRDMTHIRKSPQRMQLL